MKCSGIEPSAILYCSGNRINPMRESKRFEGMQLPQDAYEEWVKVQSTKPVQTKTERKPVEGVYESWVSKRVERRKSSG